MRVATSTTESALEPGMVRCISLWQPWASLMACGVKTLETRSWPTEVRGEVFIHAGLNRKSVKEMRGNPKLASVRAMERALGLSVLRWEEELPFGALIAKGDLIESHLARHVIKTNPHQRPFGDFSPGRYAHEYSNLEAIGRVWVRGARGFFLLPDPRAKQTNF